MNKVGYFEIQVEDFEVTAQKILEQGGQIALEKFAIPRRCWQGYYEAKRSKRRGTKAHFLDLEGNTFGLFQPDENAR